VSSWVPTPVNGPPRGDGSPIIPGFGIVRERTSRCGVYCDCEAELFETLCGEQTSDGGGCGGGGFVLVPGGIGGSLRAD